MLPYPPIPGAGLLLRADDALPHERKALSPLRTPAVLPGFLALLVVSQLRLGLLQNPLAEIFATHIQEISRARVQWRTRGRCIAGHARARVLGVWAWRGSSRVGRVMRPRGGALRFARARVWGGGVPRESRARAVESTRPLPAVIKTRQQRKKAEAGGFAVAYRRC